MTFLERDRDGLRVPLPARCLIGRGPASALRLDEPLVSGEHAVVWWDGRFWKIRDLGSRNGTHVDGERLETGTAMALLDGSLLRFGCDREVWRMVGSGPPEPTALEVGGPGWVVGDSGALMLPSEDAPEVVVMPSDVAFWVAQREDSEEEVRNGSEIDAGGRRWTLHLPEVLTTTQSREVPPSVSGIRLVFEVSMDQEYVELSADCGEREIQVPMRAHTLTLLGLARVRVADEERDLPPAEQGWVYREDLEDMLKLDRLTLNAHVFRARRQLEDLGLADAETLVERRLPTGQMRLGVAAVEIHSTGGDD